MPTVQGGFMDIVNDDRLRTLLYSAYSAATVRDMERPLLDDGVPLMRAAASAVAHTTMRLLDDEGLSVEDARIVVLAGAGDNGGDGLYAAVELANEGAHVTAVAVGRSLHEEAFDAFVHAGGRVLVLDPAADIPGCTAGFSAGEAGERLQAAIAHAQSSHVIIDAMTGIGLNGALHGIPATIALSLGLNGETPDRPALPHNETDSDLPLVVAVDTPSGVGVDDGTLPGAYIPADVTVTFGAMKPCTMVPPASYACGQTILVDFGFDIDDATPAVEMTDGDFVADSIRLPRLDDSKYSRGVVGLITGSDRYPGAAVLSAKAAARANTGMVRYLGPQSAGYMVLSALPEVVLGKGRVQSWVVGSGAPAQNDDDGRADLQSETIARLLRHYALSDVADDEVEVEGADVLAAAANDLQGHGRHAAPSAGVDPVSHGMDDDDADEAAYAMPPIVVDAGALDLLPDHVPPQVVITPHAGELARLLNRIDGETDGALTSDDVAASPLYFARRAHELTGATVLLKGAVTIVAGADGNGDTRVILSGRAPVWMGTAGSGDVLAGITGALLAQQDDMVTEDAALMPEVVAAAAYMHGLAGALASESDQRGWHRPELYGHPSKSRFSSLGHPIVAGDIVAAIPQAFAELVQ